jgi:hypothetical protein
VLHWLPSWRTIAVVAAGLGLLLPLSVPAFGGQLGQRISLKLVEYGDPAFQRRGTLTEFVYAGPPASPYGYDYLVKLKVNGICRRPNVFLASGTVRGWIQSYDYGYPGYFANDLYADAVAVVPYGTSPTDRSFGTDKLCGKRRESRTGALYIYRRASEYVWPDRSYFHVADVLVCSDQLGCNWFAGYHRRPDILGSIGELPR